MPPTIEYETQSSVVIRAYTPHLVRLRLRDGTYHPEAGRLVTPAAPWRLNVQPGSDARLEYRQNGTWVQGGTL